METPESASRQEHHCFNNGKARKPSWGWDYMIAFEAILSKSEHRVRLISRLVQAGMVVSQVRSEDKKFFLVRFSLPEQKMKQSAEQFEYKLKLKSEFGGGYLNFTIDREECFVNAESAVRGAPYFSSAERVELLLKTVASKQNFGAGIDLQKEVVDKNVAHALAIHELGERDALVQSAVYSQIWNPFWIPPFNSMRHYFGSRVGLYFVFVSFMAKMLAIVAVIGVPMYGIYLAQISERWNAVIRLTFGAVLVVWMTLFTEAWKRRNAVVNLEWGTTDFEDDTADDVRPQYRGELKPGFYGKGGFISLAHLNTLSDSEQHHVVTENIPINPHTPALHSRWVMFGSYMLTVFFCGLAAGVTFLLLFFRQKIIDSIQTNWALVIPGVLNGILISVLDNAWRSLSMYLNMRENHRSNQAFNDSLVYKRFAFQCFSNYTSLFYIAFAKPLLGDGTCQPGFAKQETPGINYGRDCFAELEIQMLTLLITRITISQVLEVCGPIIGTALKTLLTGRNVDKVSSKGALSRYYQELNLPPYHLTTEDFGEIVLLLGYVAFFGAAFPLAPLLVLINNLVEVRSDAFKILKGHRRIDADQANDIGAWYYILEFIGFAAVLINAGLLVFTSSTLDLLYPGIEFEGKILAFFVLENALVLLKLILSVSVPDLPSRVLKRKSLQDFYIARYFNIGYRASYRGVPALKVDKELEERIEAQVDDCDRVSESLLAMSPHNEQVLSDPALH